MCVSVRARESDSTFEFLFILVHFCITALKQKSYDQVEEEVPYFWTNKLWLWVSTLINSYMKGVKRSTFI